MTAATTVLFMSTVLSVSPISLDIPNIDFDLNETRQIETELKRPDSRDERPEHDGRAELTTTCYRPQSGSAMSQDFDGGVAKLRLAKIKLRYSFHRDGSPATRAELRQNQPLTCVSVRQIP